MLTPSSPRSPSLSPTVRNDFGRSLCLCWLTMNRQTDPNRFSVPRHQSMPVAAEYCCVHSRAQGCVGLQQTPAIPPPPPHPLHPFTGLSPPTDLRYHHSILHPSSHPTSTLQPFTHPPPTHTGGGGELRLNIDTQPCARPYGGLEGVAGGGGVEGGPARGWGGGAESSIHVIVWVG